MVSKVSNWRRFVIEVPPDVFEALSDRAGIERRSVKDQAAWLIEQALKPQAAERGGLRFPA